MGWAIKSKNKNATQIDSLPDTHVFEIVRSDVRYLALDIFVHFNLHLQHCSSKFGHYYSAHSLLLLIIFYQLKNIISNKNIKTNLDHWCYFGSIFFYTFILNLFHFMDTQYQLSLHLCSVDCNKPYPLQQFGVILAPFF